MAAFMILCYVTYSSKLYKQCEEIKFCYRCCLSSYSPYVVKELVGKAARFKLQALIRVFSVCLLASHSAVSFSASYLQIGYSALKRQGYILWMTLSLLGAQIQ